LQSFAESYFQIEELASMYKPGGITILDEGWDYERETKNDKFL
jgi:hypothetical protein